MYAAVETHGRNNVVDLTFAFEYELCSSCLKVRVLKKKEKHESIFLSNFFFLLSTFLWEYRCHETLFRKNRHHHFQRRGGVRSSIFCWGCDMQSRGRSSMWFSFDSDSLSRGCFYFLIKTYCMFHSLNMFEIIFRLLFSCISRGRKRGIKKNKLSQERHQYSFLSWSKCPILPDRDLYPSRIYSWWTGMKMRMKTGINSSLHGFMLIHKSTHLQSRPYYFTWKIQISFLRYLCVSIYFCVLSVKVVCESEWESEIELLRLTNSFFESVWVGQQEYKSWREKITGFTTKWRPDRFCPSSSHFFSSTSPSLPVVIEREAHFPSVSLLVTREVHTGFFLLLSLRKFFSILTSFPSSIRWNPISGRE